MNYDRLLETHEKNKADATIAVIEVPMKEASRFGIMNTDEKLRIEEFEEKPENPKSNLASMGIYIFTWKTLKKYLIEDEKNEESSHDFGHDIIPKYLEDGLRLQAHPFKGYWKDVGTVNSLWEANMDLVDPTNELNLFDPSWRVYSDDSGAPAQVIGENAVVRSVYVDKGAVIEGHAEHTVVSTNAKIAEGAKVTNTVLLPGASIAAGAKIDYAIVAEDVHIGEDVVLAGSEVTLFTNMRFSLLLLAVCYMEKEVSFIPLQVVQDSISTHLLVII